MEKIAWEQIEPVIRSVAVEASPKQLPWLRWCWVILDEFGKTSYVNETGRSQVLMRAGVLIGMLSEYEFIALDKPVSRDPEKIYKSLCDWLDCTLRVPLGPELIEVSKTIQENYRPLHELRQWYDRTDRSSIPWYDLQEDMERTLPLLGDSIQDHYRHRMIRPTEFDEEQFEDLDEYVEYLVDERYDRIWRWFDQGMRL